MDSVTDADRAYLEKFIEIYKKHTALWDSNASDYMDKNKKNDAHNELLVFMRQYQKNAEIFYVKRKINSLRSSFKRECRKQMRFEEAGITYIPQLWWFDNMSFLKHLVRMPKVPEVQVVNTSYEDVKIPPIVEPTELETPKQQQQQQLPRKKRKSLYADADDEMSNELPSDEFKVIADGWALKLRKLPPDQQIFAEKFISDILFEGQMCTLHRNSMQLNTYPDKQEAIEEFEQMNV